MLAPSTVGTWVRIKKNYFTCPLNLWFKALAYTKKIYELTESAALKRNTAVRVEFLLWWSQP
jgi:hypothetical protein